MPGSEPFSLSISFLVPPFGKELFGTGDAEVSFPGMLPRYISHVYTTIYIQKNTEHSVYFHIYICTQIYIYSRLCSSLLNFAKCLSSLVPIAVNDRAIRAGVLIINSTRHLAQYSPRFAGFLSLSPPLTLLRSFTQPLYPHNPTIVLSRGSKHRRVNLRFVLSTLFSIPFSVLATVHTIVFSISLSPLPTLPQPFSFLPERQPSRPLGKVNDNYFQLLS